MDLLLAHILSSAEGWIAIGLVAGWLVLMCLTALAGDADHAIRRHALMIEARMLRQRQQQRLKDMGIKARS